MTPAATTATPAMRWERTEMRRFELLMATVDTRDEITRVAEARQGHGRPRVAALRLL
jgi:hypothetical protein